MSKVIMRGVDCATPITKAVAEGLKAAGYKFACRYLVPKGYPKRLTVEEAKILTDAGLLILCVFETTADRAADGAINGKIDGAKAYAAAQEIGMPTISYIYFAVDFDTMDYDTVEAYLLAARAQTGDYEIGVYGSYRVIEAMAKRGVCKGFWQSYAWAYGKGLCEYANVHQCSGQQIVTGINVDVDEAYSFRGLWNYNTTSEAIALADELELSDPDYWGKVFRGKTALKPEYLKGLLEKAAGYGVDKLFENVK